MFFILLSSLCVIAESWMLWKSAAGKNKKYALIPAVISVIAAGIELTQTFDLSKFDGTLTLLASVNIMQLLCAFLSVKRKTPFYKKTAVIMLIAVFLELTVFQFPSYRLIFSDDCPRKELSLNDAVISNGNTVFDEENGRLSVYGKDEVLIEYRDLGCKVGTICADVTFNRQTERTYFVVDIADETHIDYRYDIIKTNVIKDIDRTGYSVCSFSGKLNILRAKFTNYYDSDEIIVNKIIINDTIPFHISFVRILLIIFFASAFYAFVYLKSMRKEFIKRKKICNRVFAAVTALCCALMVMITLKNLRSPVKDQFTLKSGNQITQELVDAFEIGSVSLLKDVDPDIFKVENPYDWGQRGESGLNFEWDHVFYNGKYYSYYGIAPVVLFYLPYHKITGYYCSTNFSVLLFSIIGMIFLSMLYSVFIKKFFPKTPAGMAIAGHIIIMSTCGIWYSVSRPMFYEISISSGFMFLSAGVYFLLSSGVISREKVSYVKVAFASTFMSLAVLSRPTLAVYSVCACIFYAYRFFEKKTDTTVPVSKIIFPLCALIPFAVFGGFQMWYNYVRFDSPLDFGIQYSITINDFVHSEYHTLFAVAGIYFYLINPPVFSIIYPFVTSPLDKAYLNGYYFSDVGSTAGIFFLALPMFAYFMSHKSLKMLPDKNSRIKSILFIGLPCLIMPLIIMFSVWESGYAVRYTADFSWQMIIGSYAILFFVYSNLKQSGVKNIFRKFMSVSMMYAVVLNVAYVFNFAFDIEKNSGLVYKFEQMINFWR